MKSLHEVWSKRHQKYMVEVQNYLKYIFTGHIAVVLLFALGAAGYAYSEWLQAVPADFPGALLMAGIFALLLAFSPPSTLMKEADSVYFLPMESKLDGFLKPALRWTFASQLYLPVLVFIVSLPMVNAVYGLGTAYLVLFPLLVLVLKWWNVQSEFSFRRWKSGRLVWADRLGRFAGVFGFVLLFIEEQWIFAAFVLAAILVYGTWVKRNMASRPFAYEHFISLEENRMLRFYQFANYFTDVPHLKGKIKARNWMNWVYRFVRQGPQNAHLFLVWRTFIRSDELFYLWLRLTVISMIAAWLIPFPIAAAIFAAALAFATAIQIWQGLNQTQHFRMDHLFPLTEFSRGRAVRKLILIVQTVQAALVAAVLLVMGNPSTALLLFAVVLIVSLITLSRVKK
ncbi:MAG TPA: ABC transporter permease [Planococcus sp. (in: firmicutes)]|nr:ABC transporter permease [Planococcus sp. (in: firmicutes)]